MPIKRPSLAITTPISQLRSNANLSSLKKKVAMTISFSTRLALVALGESGKSNRRRIITYTPWKRYRRQSKFKYTLEFFSKKVLAPSSTKKPFFNSLATHSSSTWSQLSRIENIFIWLWSTLGEEILDIIFAFINFSVKNRQVLKMLCRIRRRMHNIRLIIHPLKRNYPPRSQALKLGLWGKWLLEDNWFWSG